jgi:hypothetical protein
MTVSLLKPLRQYFAQIRQKREAEAAHKAGIADLMGAIEQRNSGLVMEKYNAVKKNLTPDEKKHVVLGAMKTDDTSVFGAVDGFSEADVPLETTSIGATYYNAKVSRLYQAIVTECPNIALGLARAPKTDPTLSGSTLIANIMASSFIAVPVQRSNSDEFPDCVKMAERRGMTEVAQVLKERIAALPPKPAAAAKPQKPRTALGVIDFPMNP